VDISDANGSDADVGDADVGQGGAGDETSIGVEGDAEGVDARGDGGVGGRCGDRSWDVPA
jgi:hypothetical protein